MSSFNSARPAPISVETFNSILARARAMEAQIIRMNEVADAARGEIGRLNFELRASQKEVADLRADLEVVENYGKVKREEQKNLESRIAELEKDREVKDPLFKVGVSIRSRYLEMAKKLAMGSPRSKLDVTCIERGNEAAHGAMGQADAILFHGDILSAEARGRLSVPFTEVYRSKPGDYSSLSPKMKQVIDCEATIRTLNVLNEGSRPITQRQHALDQIHILQKKYAKSSKKSFETDEDVKLRLERLIALTKEIVEEDRQSTNDRQSNGRR